jgi:hypothetical protein
MEYRLVLAYGWGWPTDADRPHRLARHEAFLGKEARGYGGGLWSNVRTRPTPRHLGTSPSDFSLLANDYLYQQKRKESSYTPTPIKTSEVYISYSPNYKLL